MRFRGVRLLGSAALTLLFLTGLPACSGQQQDDEGLAADGQDGGSNEAAADDNAADDNASGDDQAAADDNAAPTANAADDDKGDAATADKGDATENDLQEIIQEMNGQQTSETAPGAEPAAAAGEQPALAQQAADAPAPANANKATPAPANAAAPKNPTAAAPAEASNPPAFQPGGSPAAPGLPEAGSKMAYVVQHGDTLAKISQKIYGKGDRWKELATLSGLSNPSRIFPGDLVYYTLDESAVPFATAYEQVKRSEEQVKPGDTLATIAGRVYGDANAWRAIWRQNDRIDNPDVIPPGSSVFYIPKGALSAQIKKVRADLANLATLNLTPSAAKTISRADAKTSNTTTDTATISVDTNTLTTANSADNFIENGINLANASIYNATVGSNNAYNASVTQVAFN